MRICLDPGHGGNDSGAINGKRYEKDDVLRLALAIKPLLEAQGLDVLMTRKTDIAVSIAQRCAMANRENCAYFLSLHRDAASAAAYGVSMWIHSRATSATIAQATVIHNEVIKVTPTFDRKVNKGTPQGYENFGVNVQTDMSSALLELGFMTNTADNDRFDRYFNGYAKAIARGLCGAVGLVYNDMESIPDKPQASPELIYKVYEAIGTFTSAHEANNYTKKCGKDTMIMCQ